LNEISHSYCTATDNFRAEAAAVEEGFFDAGERAILKIAARFAEFDPAQDYMADLKLDANQVIQRDAFGHKIAPCQQRLNRQVVIPRGGRERFGLDERDLVQRLGRFARGAAIAGEPLAGDSFDFGDRDERGPFAGGELDRAEVALEGHGEISVAQGFDFW